MRLAAIRPRRMPGCISCSGSRAWTRRGSLDYHPHVAPVLNRISATSVASQIDPQPTAPTDTEYDTAVTQAQTLTPAVPEPGALAAGPGHDRLGALVAAPLGDDALTNHSALTVMVDSTGLRCREPPSRAICPT